MVKLCDAFNRRDLPGTLELLTEDVALQDYPLAIDGGWKHGHTGSVEWARTLVEAFGDFQLIPSGFIEAGDRFFYVVRGEGSGRSSGIPVTHQGYGVGTMRGDKLARLELFTDRNEALAALEGARA